MKTAQKKADKSAQKTKSLNVRDFPEDLLWACRTKASSQHKQLREFVIDVLREAAST